MPRYRHHLFALLGYLAFTALLTYPLVREFGRAIPGDGFDGWQNVWNIWWVKRALLVEGTNPYFTRLLDYPAGVYLYFHTLNIFNGLTFLPITLNAGQLAAYDVAAAFSFVVGGYGGYLLTLRAMSQPGTTRTSVGALAHTAAFLGGFIFAFSPYHMAHLLGHMQLISLEWLPFCALTTINLLTRIGDRPSEGTLATLRRCLPQAALSALFLVLVALCDWYYAFYMVLFIALLWIWTVTRCRARLATTLTLMTVGLMFLCATGPLWVPMVRETLGGDYMVPPAGSTERLSADLTAFFTPSSLHPIWGAWAAGWAERFTASTSERTVFAGYCVVTLAVLGLITYRRRAAIWGATAVVFGVLAMGPVLHIGGATHFAGIGPVPLPYVLLERVVPMLKIARSVSRFDVVVTLSLGILAAMGTLWLLRSVQGRWPASVGVPLAALGIVAAITLEYVAVPYPMSFPETQPFHHQLAREPGDFAVMDVPMDTWDRPANLLYQTVHQKPLVSAYTSRSNPQAPAWRTPVLQSFRYLEPDINSGDPVGLAGTVLGDLNVRYVIVHKSDLPPGEQREKTLALADDAFGAWPIVVDDEWLKVYRVPEDVGRRLPYLVLGDGWGERRWDGQQPARAIQPPATLLARLPEAQEIRLEVEAFSDTSAMLEVRTDDGHSISWSVAARPAAFRTPAWLLPPGETVIRLDVEPASASITVTRCGIGVADQR